MLNYLPRVARGPYDLMMTLEQLLSQKRDAILGRWSDLIACSPPTGAAPPVRGTDQFTNPVAHIIGRATDALYSELLQGSMDSDKVCASLDNIIKIKAVQDLSPSQAVAFVFLLKKAITEELRSEIEKRQLLGQWLEFELRIDKLASLAFDIYMQCREKICQLRVNEIKADREAAFRLLELVETAGRKRFEAIE